jgi:uncharacterized membrane protein YagU involved in acid resistance
MKDITKGIFCGLIATIPMTVVMNSLFRKLPKREKYPLPPRHITMNLSDAVGIKDLLNEDEKRELTYLCHFGYGATVGGIYGLLKDRLAGNSVSKGVAFGLSVWAVSYLGLLPLSGLLTSAKHFPVRRNSLMISAHVVWGGTLGLMMR